MPKLYLPLPILILHAYPLYSRAWLVCILTSFGVLRVCDMEKSPNQLLPYLEWPWCGTISNPNQARVCIYTIKPDFRCPQHPKADQNTQQTTGGGGQTYVLDVLFKIYNLVLSILQFGTSGFGTRTQRKNSDNIFTFCKKMFLEDWSLEIKFWILRPIL